MHIAAWQYTTKCFWKHFRQINRQWTGLISTALFYSLITAQFRQIGRSLVRCTSIDTRERKKTIRKQTSDVGTAVIQMPDDMFWQWWFLGAGNMLRSLTLFICTYYKNLSDTKLITSNSKYWHWDVHSHCKCTGFFVQISVIILLL